MQSSESIGLPPNTITDPEYSIEVGIKHFKKVFKEAGGDVRLGLHILIRAFEITHHMIYIARITVAFPAHLNGLKTTKI